MHPNQFLSDILRCIFTALGATMAILEPTLPYILICTLMILADCYTAWSLSKRARKVHPNRVSKDGKKFKSHHFGAVLLTIMIQHHITDGISIDLTKVAAGAICFWQFWSILENESSCNGAKWAIVLQKILVDKTSRHFDINLDDLKD